MKIATATEPESGEGEGCEFQELLAQPDEGTILELSETAGFSGNEENFEAPRVPGDFILAEGARKVGVPLEAGGQDDGVLDRQASALAEVWADRVSGVAEDGDPADYPGEG
jgi:hypothetical protein